MAMSKYEYIKSYELDDSCLKNCWIVVRLDGKNFHRFADSHDFKKPNDERSLHLMNKSAQMVMNEFKDIFIAYGESDEYSFIFDRKTNLHRRRASKLLTGVCSLFTSSFVYYWKEFFPDLELKYPPSFDGRTVLLPRNEDLRDYLSWRQVDCHINNLYNTTFWALVNHGSVSRKEAEERIRHTRSKEKHEMLFSEFNINYNNEPEIFKKGTIFMKEVVNKRNVELPDSSKVEKGLLISHCDVIKDSFWDTNLSIFEL